MSQKQPETQATMLNEADLNTSPIVSMIVEKDSELKDYLVEYTGKKFDEENVTVNMIVETLATEFPEFMIVVAEENFLLGYKQGLNDAEGLSSEQSVETNE
tara:strand:+ start:46 stop:348 length:303 start_codon:yes stop_codon:yes gene_type:complete